MAPMTQWREQCRLARRMAVYPLTPKLTPTPLALPEPPPLPNPFPPLILPSILFPSWPDEPTPSLTALELLPFPQGNNIVVTLHRLNMAGEGLTDEVLLEWALDVLCPLEDWRWLWSPEPMTTPSPSPTPSQPLPLWCDAFNVSPLNMFTPNVLNTYALSVELPLQVTPNAPASCIPAPSVENSVMWAPVFQPQPWLSLPLSLPKWVTLESFELASQGYKRGNVMIKEPPTSFSPFSPTDCMLLSHFSFNDFIAVAFLDLARDLDIQI